MISLSASISGHHTRVLSGDGSVRCWGHNDTGQLDDGTRTNRLMAIEVPSFRFNIDPAVVLYHSGRVVMVTAPVACLADQQVMLFAPLPRRSR